MTEPTEPTEGTTPTEAPEADVIVKKRHFRRTRALFAPLGRVLSIQRSVWGQTSGDFRSRDFSTF